MTHNRVHSTVGLYIFARFEKFNRNGARIIPEILHYAQRKEYKGY